MKSCPDTRYRPGRELTDWTGDIGNTSRREQGHETEKLYHREHREMQRAGVECGADGWDLAGRVRMRPKPEHRPDKPSGRATLCA